MIETSYLSVSALYSFDNSKDSHRQKIYCSNPGIPAEVLVGFAILSDTPRAGLSEDWLEWFSETHAPADTEVTMTNTLWMDFAIAASARAVAGIGSATTDYGSKEEREEADAAEAIESIVRTVFSTLPEVDYLVMSLPGGGSLSTPEFLLTAFEVLARHADAPPNNLDEAYGKPLLLLCDRMAFLPTLAVRKVDIEG